MSFVEQRLLDAVGYGFNGGPTFSTNEAYQKSGARIAEAERSRPLYRFTAPYESLIPDDHKGIINLFNACQGKAHSFRFKDWADFEATAEFVVVGTDSEQVVQLSKYYTVFSLTTRRPIKKPVSGTVQLFADGTPIASSIDYTTGIATFTAPINSNVTWSGEFDVPVHFANDSMPFDYNNFEALTADIELEEEFIP